MADIYVGLLEDAYLEQTVVGNKIHRTISLTIPDSLLTAKESNMIIEYERKQSVEFWLERANQLYDQTGKPTNTKIKIASHENPIMTPCAGALSFVKDPDTRKTYLAMAQKDQAAPRDPGFRVPRNGFPRETKDWLTMDHLVAETFEEGIFVEKDTKRIILPYNSFYDKIILEVAANLEKHTNIRFCGTTRASMYFEPGNDTLKIESENGLERSLGASISWTPETGFNVIQRLILHYPLSNLLFVDGETFPNGKPIKRDYCVMDLDHITGKKFGEPITETVYKHLEDGSINIQDRNEGFYTDKVPRSVLCQTEHNNRPVYPIEWLLESKQFLSNPKIIRESHLKNYSALERKQYESGHKTN